MLYTLAATACFALMDGVSKLLVLGHPLPLVLWLRHLFAFPFLLLLLMLTGTPIRWRSQRPALQFLRSALLVIQIAIAFVGFRALPLAEVHAILAASPLVVTAASAPLLGERVTPRAWFAVVLGFVGVLVILRPGLIPLEPAVLVVCAGIFVYASYQLLTRRVGRIDPPSTSFALQLLFSVLLLTPLGPLYWEPLAAWEWALIALLGALGTLGHYSLIRALALAPAALVQPFTYTHLLWVSLVGLLLFREFPDFWTVTGAAVVVAAGIWAILDISRRAPS